jgi:dihydroxyacetone kinase-like predicted kinase
VAPSEEAIASAVDAARSAQVFVAGKDATVGGVTVARGKPAATIANRLVGGETLLDVSRAALEAMGAAGGGLITVYYGGAQKEREAQRISEELQAAFPDADVEYYYGGMKNAEFWLSLDE